MVHRNTKLVRVKNEIITKLDKDKKKGESYSDVLDRYVRIKIKK